MRPRSRETAEVRGRMAGDRALHWRQDRQGIKARHDAQGMDGVAGLFRPYRAS
jgi:hypothetical protein